MTSSRPSQHLALLLVGGGLFAAGVAVGAWSRGPGVPKVFAATAAADESFAACTTPIADGVEGLFLLDFETGDLTGGVLNRGTTKFTSTYRHNVLKDLDFKAGKVKSPKFLLTAGAVEFTGPGSAGSALYVTDASTGVTVAYGIPWNAQQPAAAAALVPLDKARPRGGKAP